MYFQNKYYPKDSAKDALCKGRVRVQLKQSDASFVNEKFQSSKLIYQLSVHYMSVKCCGFLVSLVQFSSPFISTVLV